MFQPTILLTGFEPFNQAKINPSAEVVTRLATNKMEGLNLETCILPVATEMAPVVLRQHLDRLRPDFVLSLGEARGRSAIAVEQVGANEMEFSIPDNNGVVVRDETVVEGGPSFYPVTLPTQEICQAIRRRGIPSVLSTDAGRYLCNQILYIGLHWATVCSPKTRVGFIHLPSLPQQVAAMNRPVPTMALTLELVAVQTALLAILQTVSIGYVGSESIDT